MSSAHHGHTSPFACCHHCHGKPCLHHSHHFHRYALIALAPHHRVPHACPVWLGHASDHVTEAFVRSLSEAEVHEALREVGRANHHAHLHHITNLNARAQLGSTLNSSRHSHLLIGVGAVAGAGWGKSGGRIGESHKEKKEKDGKESKEEEEETKEAGRLVGIELECQHAEKEEKPEGKGEGHGEAHEGHAGHESHGANPESGQESKGKSERKKRWAETGETLGVVPKATGTDTVKLKAKTQHDPDWINWTGKGWKGFEHRGEEYAYKVPGFGVNSIIDLLPENGIWGVRTPPKIIEVEAKDQDGRTARAKIAVYPDHMNTMKGRIGEKSEEGGHEEAKKSLLGRLIGLAEEIKHGLHKIPLLPVEVEPLLPEGTWHLTLGFKEDTESNAVFMLVDLGAGFDPLIGIGIKFPIPMTKLMQMIPEKLREHLGDIQAFFELEGKFFAMLSMGRFAPKELNLKGEFGGIIGASLNFSLQIGAKKLLKVIAKAGSEIKPEGLFQSGGVGNGDELRTYGQISVEFGGLTGSIAWDVWDGKFTHENTWRFLDPQVIYESRKFKLF